MKTIFTKSFLFAFALVCSEAGHSQTKLPPGQAAKFGIDGDLKSDERQNGSFLAAGSHDWFKKAGGTGLGLIDTTGAAGLKKMIQAGGNIAFSRKMQFPRYSVQDGVLLMDASYARDYMGSDYTAFSGNSTKNTASPAQWGTASNGGNVSDKTDILDTYVSMRRNGNVITGNNVSNLIATMALTTLSTTGDHYADFEFYKERISFNPATGNFQNSGPASTGGHSAWEFNTDGSIKAWGDMTISFSFNSSSVSDIKILIWVSEDAYQKTKPKNFDFVKGEFYLSTSVNNYGYAAILPKGNGNVVAWGTVNQSNTGTPVWGSNSKEAGSNADNYYSDSYSAGQFAEAAVDLTTLGIDRAFYTENNPCNPPFTRFVTKSRSSSSFSSALSDFTGPYEFLDAPTAPATVLDPAALSCNLSAVNLEPASYLKGAFYSWTTPDGRIVNSNTDSSSVKIDKAGTYILTAAMAKGCETTLDSVVVLEDRFKPKAMAAASAPLVFPGGSVTLIGGDPLESNYATPFGLSKGLTWKWTGPSGFTSSLQSPVTTLPGIYTLTVTESRNGCTDVAYTSIGVGTTLSTKFVDFSVNTNQQKKANNLSWKMANVADVETFVVEKSRNGAEFTSSGYVFADNAVTTYEVKDNTDGSTSYYRIKALTKGGSATYSSIIKAEGITQPAAFKAYADGGGIITVSYTTARAETVEISVVNMFGQVVKVVSRKALAGTNTFKLSEVAKPVDGMYVISLQGQRSPLSDKIKW